MADEQYIVGSGAIFGKYHSNDVDKAIYKFGSLNNVTQTRIDDTDLFVWEFENKEKIFDFLNKTKDTYLISALTEIPLLNFYDIDFKDERIDELFERLKKHIEITSLVMPYTKKRMWKVEYRRMMLELLEKKEEWQKANQ
jgi:hypothetical protein